MSYEHLIDEQIALERHAISQGIKRLHDQTRKVESQKYASASVYGCASISTLLPLVTQSIESTMERATKRAKNGRAFKEINQYLATIEPLALAGIACKLTFDHIFSFDKPDTNRLTNVCDGIYRAVEAECQMRHYEAKAPGLLNKLKQNYGH